MGEMRKSVTIGIRLTEKERDELELAAEKAGLSVGAYVRKCIDLGGVASDHKELIAHVHQELKRALLDTLKRELPFARKKSA